MIKMFEEFITESKNYPIYKGVSDLYDILKNNELKSSGTWESQIRKNIGIKNGISVSRDFNFAKIYGDVIEFNTQKLSDNYKIKPFSENPDYYLWYQGDNTFKTNIKGTSPEKTDDSLKKMLRDKIYGKQYWDVKTNKDSDDFNIAEELIVAKKIPNIIKYIKKIYLTNKDKKIETLLKELNIPYEISEYEETLSDLKYKNKIKTYSQI